MAFAVIPNASLGAEDGATRYEQEIRPLLEEYCYGCHAQGAKKGGVSLEEAVQDDRDLWHAVLKNTRAGLMPPAGKPRPTTEEMALLENWIKRDAFRSDPADPDPGRVTLRRLNRVEYRNTIRDLMGIDFRADEEFPADDAGYGFDNIGDVLTVSPLLLEKYMQAAEAIVAKAVPTATRSLDVRTIAGDDFRGNGGLTGGRFSFYQEAKLSHTVKTERKGRYRLVVEVEVDGTFNPEPGRCRLAFAEGDRQLMNEEFGWHDNKEFRFEFEQDWQPGDHPLSFSLEPLVPAEPTSVKLDMKILSVRVEGPLEPERWGRPKNYERFFAEGPPDDPEARRLYTREALGRFATKAYRRPVDDRTLDRLTAIADRVRQETGKSFEQGLAQAMVAVLASPRFLFRVEGVEPGEPGRSSSPLDEYSLASRLSYFLWSTMPDEELLGLAGRHGLRADLNGQVKRMLDDPRSQALIENFAGQWLQVRDIEHFPIQVRSVLRQDGLPTIPDTEVGSLRRFMRQETQMYLSHVMREDRSVLELIDSDYTFVNERLARHYGIPDVTGREVRRVTLPEGSPRGGLLTQAGLLMVTSNPTRTSPVKRGQFILENFLGTPAPPPPPDIPALEEARRAFKDRQPTAREMMELHRAAPLCASCHSRMDPLGLALENFNALGMWREQERRQPIDASGQLISGKSFKDIRELKAILKGDHRSDFYRCLTEKMMTYALGRGMESHDVEAMDQVVDRLERQDGRFSALLTGVIESAPFQRRRNAAPSTAALAPGSDPLPKPTRNGTKP